MHHRNIQLTADQAKALLAQHANVRPLNPGRVSGYVADMLSGDWRQDSPQGLVFDQAGNLADGQHRLTAQVRAGLTLSWFATFDAPPDVIATLDQGGTRPLAANLFSSSKQGKKKIEIINMLRLFYGSTSRRLTVAQMAQLLKQAEGPAFDEISAHQGKPLVSATTRTAFYCWALKMPRGLELWRAVTERDPNRYEGITLNQRITFEVLVGLSVEKLQAGHVARQEVFKRLCGALQAFFADRGLRKAMVNDAAAAHVRPKFV